MLLKELEIKHYTRLYIPNIKYLHYMPKQNMQIILASNGSGKSSLLKEIIPNVEDLNKEYDEDGYRIAKYLHKNKTYELSYIRNTNKHSFKINGTELNQAGLKKTQKTLIEEHFKLTKHIHEMLLSNTTFTNMSVSERKRWFTDILTSIDYKYAMDKYNKAKLHTRDLTSYIKLIQSKIMFDDKSLEEMTDTYIEQLKNDKQNFIKLLDSILAQRPLASEDSTLNMDTILDNQKELYRLINKYKNSSDIDILKHVNTLLISKEFELKTLDKKTKEIRDKLKDINNNGLNISEDKTELESNLKNIKDELDKYVKDTNLTYDDYKIYVEELLMLHSDLLDITNSLSDLDGIDVTSKNIKTISDKIAATRQELKSKEHTVATLDRELQKQIAYSEAEDVTCPKCTTVFKPNHDAQKLASLKSALANELDKKEILDKKLDDLIKDMEKIDAKRNLIAKLKLSLVNERLAPIYEDLKKSSDLFFNTHIISRKISDIYATLPTLEHITDSISKYKDIKQKILVLESITLDKLSYLQNVKRTLEDELSKTLQKSIEVTNDINKYKNIIADKNKIVKYIDMFKTTISKVKSIKKEKYDKLLKDYYNELIYIIKHEIAEIDNKLVEYDKIKSHREELVKELDEYKTELVLAKKLEDYLSPTKGIIGESISNTINVILERMNEIINTIWTYEINILPCDTDLNDLTFRFPVKLNNNKEIIDVSKGSSAIKEVIDLAFKITAMEFLDMLDYPLVLDEFSATMDPVHRARSYDFIEDISRDKFTQIFMVSHYETMYSRFNHTDVVVLNNDNLNYQGAYNEVIKIQH